MPILRNARHEKFCREYVIDHNASKAAIRAGFTNGPGIGVTASRLLKDPKISERIAYLDEKHMKAADITAERVLEELGRIAFAKAVDGVKNSDKTTALRMLAQRFKLIGSEADEALNNLAMSFAERVTAAQARMKTGGKP